MSEQQQANQGRGQSLQLAEVFDTFGQASAGSREAEELSEVEMMQRVFFDKYGHVGNSMLTISNLRSRNVGPLSWDTVSRWCFHRSQFDQVGTFSEDTLVMEDVEWPGGAPNPPQITADKVLVLIRARAKFKLAVSSARCDAARTAVHHTVGHRCGHG